MKIKNAVAIVVALGFSSPAVLSAQRELFTSLGSTVQADASAPGGVGRRRSRTAVVALDQLASGRVSGAADVAPGIVLNLFTDARFDAVLDRVDLNPGGGFTWVGGVGHAENPVALAVRDGYVVGNIRVSGTDYQIRPNDDGTHTISEVDLSELPPELDPVPAYGDPSQSVNLDSDVALDSAETIDVMVVYTDAARIAQGGTTQMQALIDLAVSETNTGYQNSGVLQRLRLVHTAELAYAETGDIGFDLDALTTSGDGQLDAVHGLRDTYGADAVVLLVENGGLYCGIAWLMYTVSPTLEDRAFSVVDTACATGYYSFGHELGHNMGARHDRYVDNTDGSPFDYNHGFVNVQDSWRTIMAYNSECSASSKNCTRLNQWSNPDLTFGGDPMGVPQGQAGAADNRMTLNNTALTFANFRQSILSNPSVEIDTPLTNQKVRLPLTVSGWAVDPAAAGGAGIDLVQVSAIPQGGGPAVPLGNATLGIPRPDVASLFGDPDFDESGFSLNVPGPLPPGLYTLRVSARSSVSGDFTIVDRSIEVLATTYRSMDSQRFPISFGAPFMVEGWAFNTGADSGTGVDYIEVWAFPEHGASPIFLGNPALGLSRPDIGVLFGTSVYDDSGFSLQVNAVLPRGRYRMRVYFHTSVTGDFDSNAMAMIRIQ